MSGTQPFKERKTKFITIHRVMGGKRITGCVLMEIWMHCCYIQFVCPNNIMSNHYRLFDYCK